MIAEGHYEEFLSYQTGFPEGFGLPFILNKNHINE